MTISLEMFSMLVSLALFITVLTPIVLIALFIRDGQKGEIW